MDRATAMPLKTELVDESGRMMEQIRFTSIRLPDRIPESAVRPTVAADAFAWQRSDARPDPAASVQDGEWQAAELPPGFALLARRAKVAPDSPAGLRHLVYGDGLASVSVFIEMAVAASEQAEGVSRIGAANAYTTIVVGHMVTAVGEVPVRTVQMIASSLRPARRQP
jgi:sigma-E factor negative regulatory protein RseB